MDIKLDNIHNTFSSYLIKLSEKKPEITGKSAQYLVETLNRSIYESDVPCDFPFEELVLLNGTNEEEIPVKDIKTHDLFCNLLSSIYKAQNVEIGAGSIYAQTAFLLATAQMESTKNLNDSSLQTSLELSKAWIPPFPILQMLVPSAGGGLQAALSKLLKPLYTQQAYSFDTYDCRFIKNISYLKATIQTKGPQHAKVTQLVNIMFNAKITSKNAVGVEQSIGETTVRLIHTIGKKNRVETKIEIYNPLVINPVDVSDEIQQNPAFGRIIETAKQLFVSAFSQPKIKNRTLNQGSKLTIQFKSPKK